MNAIELKVSCGADGKAVCVMITLGYWGSSRRLYITFLKNHITLYIDTSNERRKCKCAVGLVGRGVGFK